MLLVIAICIGIAIILLNALRATSATKNLLLQFSTTFGKAGTKRWEDCGGTPEEARRRNCHFDILSMAWQTHECFDHATTSAFLAHYEYFNTSSIHSDNTIRQSQSQKQDDKDVAVTAWRFFLDEAGQNETPLSVVLSGQHKIYVTQEYHYTHCTYMWRQMHRAYAELGYIDSHLANWGHTLHCQKVLLGGIDDKDKIGAVGKVLYPKCIKVGDGLRSPPLIQAGPY